MTAVAVTFDGTAGRVNDAEANTNWANLGGGGPAPASEAQLKYQGSNAVNRKVTSTTARQGVQYDPASGATDMTAVTNELFFFKGNVADFGDLNATYGVEARIGSSSTDYYHYNIAGSGANQSVFDAYPAQGGYLLVAINPTISAWREGTAGTPDLTAVDYFGMAAQFVAGGAKSENLAMDAIDIGSGLELLNGDGADADGTFIDFLDTDQNTNANRWGVVNGTAPVVFARGRLKIGDGIVGSTEFTDTTSIVLFVDGYHGPGDLGVYVSTEKGTNVHTIGAQIIGLGSATTSDTRPDFTVIGTTGSLTLSAVIGNHRNVTLTSAVDADGADIECDDLTQASAEIQNSIIRTTAATNVATIDDATFGTTTDLHDTEFIQGGAGHAIEITSTGSLTFTGITFTGYGGTPGSNLVSSSGASDAAIFNDSGGAVTITISGGGDSPSVRNGAGATTTIISGAVTVKVTAVTKDGTPVQFARVLLKASDNTQLPFEESVTITRSGSTATVSHTAHGMENNDKVAIDGADQAEYNGVKTISNVTTNAYDFTVSGTPTTPATGTIIATFTALAGLTDVNGELSASRVYSSAQPVDGWTRKNSASPFLQEGLLTGTISTSTGFDQSAVMVADE